jgi:thymidine phosphorylase
MGVARLCHKLGCGRTTPGSNVKFEPGVILLKKPGEAISNGEPLIEIHLPNGANCNSDPISVKDIFTYSDDMPNYLIPLIVQIVD